MGSKTPPLDWSSPEAHSEDSPVRRPSPSDGPAGSLLLRRIADALQMPPSTLYRLPNAVDAVAPSKAAPVAVDSDIEIECAALLLAYRRIHDPKMRCRLLALIQAEAKRT
jgi:hypothetical protein